MIQWKMSYEVTNYFVVPIMRQFDVQYNNVFWEFFCCLFNIKVDIISVLYVTAQKCASLHVVLKMVPIADTQDIEIF